MLEPLLGSIPWYRSDGLSSANTTSSYIYVGIIIGVIVFLFETWLNIRQISRQKKASGVPQELGKILKEMDVKTPSLAIFSKTQESVLKSKSYTVDKMSFELFSSSFNFLIGMLAIISGFLPQLWDISTDIVYNRLHFTKESDGSVWLHIAPSLVFTVLLIVINSIMEIPFSLYSIFVIEERHGFNKQTLSLFASDKLKGMALSIAIQVPVLIILLLAINWGGRYFYYYVWIAACGIAAFLVAIYPTVIAPIFNKFSLLESSHPKLTLSIKTLADKIKFPLSRVYVVDGSKRSQHSNAYFYGFFKQKRIVLFDTLLKQAGFQDKEDEASASTGDDDIVLSVLAHEMGHWKHFHTMKGFVVSQFYLFMAFYAFSLCYNDMDMYKSYGFNFESSPGALVGLLLFHLTIWEPMNQVLGVISHVMSRMFEFQADAFACKMNYSDALSRALVNLHIENLGNLDPDPIYSLVHYSHPPLVERLKAISATKHKSD